MFFVVALLLKFKFSCDFREILFQFAIYASLRFKLIEFSYCICTSIASVHARRHVCTNIIHRKVTKSSIENSVFSIFMGSQNVNENVFHGLGNLVIWLGKSFGNIFEGVCTNPVYLQNSYNLCAAVSLLENLKIQNSYTLKISFLSGCFIASC